MTIKQKQELYRNRGQNREMSVTEWQQYQNTLIRWIGSFMVIVMTVLFWMVGSR